MLKGYIDDFRFLRIETDVYEDEFVIYNKRENLTYTTKKVYLFGDVYIHELRLGHDIFLGTEYTIYNINDENTVLKPRQIIKTKKFEETFYYDGDLGCIYEEDKSIFRVWAPTSTKAILDLRNHERNERRVFDMYRMKKGFFETQVYGNYDGWRYSFLIENDGTWKECLDPYATGSSINSSINCVIDPSKHNVSIPHAKVDDLPISEAIIYELHVRDFSISKEFEFKNKGKFLAFTEHGLVNKFGQPIGIDYLINLGITHVQLLPIFDFASVAEFSTSKKYNWGYDPEQFNVVEGRYSTNPRDPYNRIIELKNLISELKKHNIGVIMDVVYNHVYRMDDFSYGKIFPRYFFRTDDFDQFSNGTGVGNDIASEKPMVRKFIVDSLKYWLSEFKLNGFRFDLMGIHDIETIKEIQSELQKINPNVYLYGEGWELHTAYNPELLCTQKNALQIPEIGFFNDYFRDTVKGHNNLLSTGGIGTGDTHQIDRIDDILRCSINRNIYATPMQSINYVSCHDNHILYDRIVLSTVHKENITSFQKICFAMVLLSQGVPFIHGGDEFSRTKNGVENTYDSPDAVNQINWNLIETNFDLYEYVEQLIHIRKMHDVFRLTDFEAIKKQVHVTNHENLITYELTNPEPIKNLHVFPKYTVYFNLSHDEREVILKKKSFDLIEGNSLIGVQKIAPYSVLILGEKTV